MNLIGLAIRDNQTAIVERILRMSPQTVNAKDGFGNTALHYAMLNGDDAMLNLLATYTPDNSILNHAGQTPLAAVIMGKLFCLQEGQSIPVDMDPPPAGITPLHLAAWVGNVDAGRALVGTGQVPIDFKDQYGNTALHYSSLRDHTAFSMMCVSEFKASVLIPNNANELAMEVAQTARLSLRPRQGAALEA